MVDYDKNDMEKSVEEISDTHHEDPEIEDIEDRLEDKLKVLKAKLRECESSKSELHEGLQRAKADFLNSRRRLEEQSARNVERATDGILAELLPLVDTFDTALGNPELVAKLDPEWQKGIDGIRALLRNFLNSHDIVEIETAGQHFNPHEHEALSNVPVTDVAHADTVVDVLQKGYKRGETVLRPAKVTVGEFKK